MTWIFEDTPRQRHKFRKQAERAALHLKSEYAKGNLTADPMKCGFAFDDAIVRVDIPAQTIRELTGLKLGEVLYRLITDAAKRAHERPE
jgi:hypothetical protein